MNIHLHNKVLSIILFPTISILALSIATLYIFPRYHNSDASALTYSNESKVSFTFSPMISISVSSNTIDIPTVVPGTTVESTPITVTVGTNTAYGYSLYTDVGNSTDYNTDSLVHISEDNPSDSNNSTPAVFTNIPTNASLSQLTTDNTWGYSFKPSSESNWSAYNGLPLYSTVGNNTSTNNPALLIDTKSPADSTESIDFKIAAKASITQASGTYNNVINFYAVGKPAPLTINDITYLQEFAYDPDSIKASMPEHVVYALKDIRDDREYAVAKLKDGKVWMTQNLDLAGGTKLYSETSDVPEGYPESGNSPYYSLPVSSTTGFDDDSSAYVYNVPYADTNRTACANNHPCYSYYSWAAATVGSGINITESDTDAQHSICPKGWRLPSSRANYGPDWQSADFYQLAIAYGMDPSETLQYPSDFYNQAGPGTIPNFLLTGYYSDDQMWGPFINGGSSGYYWSSTSMGNGDAEVLYFYSIHVRTATDGYRRYGRAIRCLAR